MKPTRFEIAVLLIVAGILTYCLFIPPLIGLADSGDFGRVMPWRGLLHASENYNEIYFHYFTPKFKFIPKFSGPEPYLTSTSLLIIPAVWLSVAAGQDQIFDIRLLAALHALLFLLGLWLVLVATRPLKPGMRILVACLLVVVIADVGYIAYFNSFYSEGAALVFLTIALGCGLILLARQSSSALLLIGYYVAIILFVTSKPMYISLVPAFVLFGFYLSGYLSFTRRRWLAVGLGIILCGVAFWYYRQAPRELREQSVYVGVFTDLLPHSSTPQEDLMELGLDPNYAVYSKTTPFQDSSPLRVNPEFQEDFSQKAKAYALPLFYLRHPARFYGLSKRCMRNAFETRVDRLGYYEAASGRPAFSKPFGLWSFIRENVFPRTVLFLSIFFATGIGAVIIGIKSSAFRPMAALYLMFIFIAIMQFFVAVTVGGGEPDVGKHLFLFNLAFDVCFILWVLGTSHLVMTFGPSLRARRKALKANQEDDRPEPQGQP
jgi:hypothetical protein